MLVPFKMYYLGRDVFLFPRIIHATDWQHINWWLPQNMSACKIFLYMGIIWGRRMKRRFIMKIALKDGSVK